MRRLAFLLSVFLCLQTAAQQNRYWIKFKDKNNNPYSLNNPEQFLSQQSIDRRSKQNISLDSTDLPITPAYVDSVTRFISALNHRLKWRNLIVAEIDNPGYIQTSVLENKDTIFNTDTVPVTIFDTTVIYYRINVSLSGYSNDTLVSHKSTAIRDSIFHPGPVIFADSVFLTDTRFGNKFDSIRNLSVVDSIGEISSFPPRLSYKKEKFEDVFNVDQRIIYPNKYGAAYHQINMLNADLLHQMGYRGSGITIAMMDNGFYNANNLSAYDSVRPFISGTWDFVNNESDVYNDGGHGENTFSCMAANVPYQYIGTAPDANFYLFVTEDNNAEWVMEEYNWAAAAEVADSVGAQVFSTSLGYTTFDNNVGSHVYSDLDGDRTVITHAGNMAFAKGILVLNSAGNEGDDPWLHISAPADGNDILAIGAVDSTEKVAGFSGRGPNSSGKVKPDICSQGVNSAVIQTDGSVGHSGGTSFSCPIMAGCVASLWSAFPDKSAKEIKDAIVISASHFWAPDSLYGYGIPNFYNAYLFLKTNYNGQILRVSNDAVVFPNPFSSELNISLFNNEAGNRKVELFNLAGQRLYREEIFIRDKTFEIVRFPDTHKLSTGEYVLKLDGDKEKTYRVIKVK